MLCLSDDVKKNQCHSNKILNACSNNKKSCCCCYINLVDVMLGCLTLFMNYRLAKRNFMVSANRSLIGKKLIKPLFMIILDVNKNTKYTRKR